MFTEYQKEKYPYLTNYFELSFSEKSGKYPQSVIFYGMDIINQYFLALEIARYLNCQGTKESDCNCQSCRWINQNEHPAVQRVSKIDYKQEKDTSKTVISVNQTELVKDELSLSSDWHRVFIFCDAELENEENCDKSILQEFEKYNMILPKQGEKIWCPKPLNSKVLEDVAANSLLKIIEEPPENVTFFFLTQDKNDLISTIVSRSEAFFVPSFIRQNYHLDLWSSIFHKYPEIDTDKMFLFTDKIYECMEENNLDTIYMLNSLEEYFMALLKNNLQNKSVSKKIMRDLQHIYIAKKQVKARVNIDNVLETLYLNFGEI